MELKDYALIRKATLTDIGDGIREQEGSTEDIPPDEMGDRVRALVRGGGVEYTTGRVTYQSNYGAKTITHGLSQAPKLFVLVMDGYTTALNTNLCGLIYTEYISGLFRNNSTEEPGVVFMSPYTVPDIALPEYNAIIVDDTQVEIRETNRKWTAADYTWEAYTW